MQPRQDGGGLNHGRISSDIVKHEPQHHMYNLSSAKMSMVDCILRAGAGPVTKSAVVGQAFQPAGSGGPFSPVNHGLLGVAALESAAIPLSALSGTGKPALQTLSLALGLFDPKAPNAREFQPLSSVFDPTKKLKKVKEKH
ncbi:MAG: hypothetical protein C5B50_08360 [Verrucomicrobia bacterium]|nr:MAG: hypothetical protein C5B50_08360 [Verrucomicrobiota bacterium]